MRHSRAVVVLVCLGVALTAACSADESGDVLASEASVGAVFDGNTCSIAEADPGYVPAAEGGMDLLAAAPDASLTFVVTNTSGEELRGLVNRYDPSLSPTEALALHEAFREMHGDVEGTMFDKPDFITAPAMSDFGAEQLALDENQLQYHYTLQPGLSTTLVYTNDGIWSCNTSSETLSLIDVPPAESTSS